MCRSGLGGETRQAQIFVAVLGTSNFLYAEASWTQELGDWIESHNRALAALGGVPALLVPDNTKVAVIKACLFDPVINRTYADLAAHQGTAVLPARPYKPRGKVELNAAIGEFCCRLNDERVIRRVNQTRRHLLQTVERPALKPLPAEPYVLAEWRVRRVGIDYHVEVENHFYSVPTAMPGPRRASGCVGHSRRGGLSRLVSIVVGQPRIPALEQRPERAVERPRSGLQEQVRAALGPLHLLTLGEALADDRVHCALGQA